VNQTQFNRIKADSFLPNFFLKDDTVKSGMEKDTRSQVFAMRSLYTFQLPRIVWRAAVLRVSHVTLPLFVPSAVGRAPFFLCVYYGSDKRTRLIRRTEEGVEGLCTPLGRLV